MAVPGTRHPRLLSKVPLPGDPHADLRAQRTFQPRHRQRHRRGAERDVHLQGQVGSQPDPASREHGSGGAGGDRKQPVRNPGAPALLLRRAHVPLRQAAERPLPPVPAVRHRSFRRRIAAGGRRSHFLGRGFPEKAADQGRPAGIEFGGLPAVPSCLSGGAAPGGQCRERRAVRRLPAQDRQATLCASSTASCRPAPKPPAACR